MCVTKIKYKILAASPFVNNKGRRKNTPARESNPGSLIFETSALTIQPRELVWLDRHQIQYYEWCIVQHPHHM